jgi:hypothetical protein
MPASLADFFTRTQFDYYRASTPNGEQPDKPFLSFLEALKAEGRLSLAKTAANRTSVFTDDWNAFVEDRLSSDRFGDIRLLHLVQNAYGPILCHWEMQADRSRDVGLSEGQSAAAAYDGLVCAFDTGSFEDGYYNINDKCISTGERLDVRLEGWTPRLCKRAKGGYVDVGPVEVAPWREFDIPFPSGKALAADWFRIPAFTETVDPAGAFSDDPDSVLGREKMAERYALKHGFVSVHCGGGQPNISVFDGVVAAVDYEDPSIGETGVAPHGVADKGRIPHGLRHVTIIDKQTLVDIVAGKLGQDEAKKTVSAYLKAEGSQILKFDVEPGVHHLYCTGKGDVGEFFTPDGVDLHGTTPRILLSPRKLEPAPEVAAGLSGP